MNSYSHLPILTRRGLLGGIAGSAAFAVMTPMVRAATVLNVVATTGMIADAVRQVGGDLVSVKALMGPGVDPHGYRQTRSDIVAMTRAGTVLWHGLYLEAQMERFFEDLARKLPVVAVAENLPRDQLLGHADYDGRFDPHVWMDPDIWKLVVDAVATALTAAHPDGAAQFESNAKQFKTQLNDLGAYATQVLGNVPQDQRVLVTAHDAFGYFGKAYGFDVIGIQGISTESEAGLNRISDLVTTLVDREIGAVFVETSVSDRNMRALIEGAAAQGHRVNIAGSLFSDAMGPDGTYEGTYLGMIDHNVTTIARALGADAPAGGWLNKLSMES